MSEPARTSLRLPRTPPAHVEEMGDSDRIMLIGEQGYLALSKDGLKAVLSLPTPVEEQPKLPTAEELGTAIHEALHEAVKALPPVPQMVHQSVNDRYLSVGAGASKGHANLALGLAALGGMSGAFNLAVGHGAGVTRQEGMSRNTILGHQALTAGLHDLDGTTTVGFEAMEFYTAADFATAVGFRAGGGAVGEGSIALGAESFRSQFRHDNAVALGYRTVVTQDGQIQLGNPEQYVSMFGNPEIRLDLRDMDDVRDTRLGLEFILALRPVDYRRDARESYIDWNSYPNAPPFLRPRPAEPEIGIADYDKAYSLWEADVRVWDQLKFRYDQQLALHREEVAAWHQKNNIGALVHDGTHKADRYSHGFVPEEVKKAADQMGQDFGGYRDHLVDGTDIRGLAPAELIAPLVKAVQDLHSVMTSPMMIERIAAEVLRKLNHVR